MYTHDSCYFFCSSLLKFVNCYSSLSLIFVRRYGANRRFFPRATDIDARSLLNCENPGGRPFSAFRMLRSVNAPPPSRSGKPTIFFPLSFPTCCLSTIVFSLRFSVGISPFVGFGVHRHRRELEAQRVSTTRTTTTMTTTVTCNSSLSTNLFLFSSFTSVILHLDSPATLYRGASIKFIRPLVAATLQDGSRRLATLCFSTLTLSSLLSLALFL